MLLVFFVHRLLLLLREYDEFDNKTLCTSSSPFELFLLSLLIIFFCKYCFNFFLNFFTFFYSPLFMFFFKLKMHYKENTNVGYFFYKLVSLCLFFFKFPCSFL